MELVDCLKCTLWSKSEMADVTMIRAYEACMYKHVFLFFTGFYFSNRYWEVSSVLIYLFTYLYIASEWTAKFMTYTLRYLTRNTLILFLMEAKLGKLTSGKLCTLSVWKPSVEEFSDLKREKVGCKGEWGNWAYQEALQFFICTYNLGDVTED
jgi:hypothetical protein